MLFVNVPVVEKGGTLFYLCRYYNELDRLKYGFEGAQQVIAHWGRLFTTRFKMGGPRNFHVPFHMQDATKKRIRGKKWGRYPQTSEQ